MVDQVVEADYDRMESSTLTVGTTQVAFPTPTSTTVLPEKTLIQAASTNSVAIVVGKTGVLANLSNGGWEMSPGTSMVVPYALETNLYAVSGSSSQKLLVTYLSKVG